MYQQTHDLQLIRWIGRWEAEKTVEHYLQEAPAALAAARLPSSVRQRIRTLAGLLPDTLYAFEVRARNDVGYGDLAPRTFVQTPSAASILAKKS